MQPAAAGRAEAIDAGWQVLRLLENEQVTPEEVDDALKDGLEYYLGDSRLNILRPCRPHQRARIRLQPPFKAVLTCAVASNDVFNTPPIFTREADAGLTAKEGTGLQS